MNKAKVLTTIAAILIQTKTAPIKTKANTFQGNMGNHHCCSLFARRNTPYSTTSSNTASGQDKKDLLLKGVSLYYMKHVLLQEVKDAGLDVDHVKVYELEPDLTSAHNFGLIRKKGANVICSRDGKVGASYVDSIIEEESDGSNKYVSHARNAMLSYTWGYGIKAIVETLAAKCRTDGQDTKTAYIW
eukprot:CAMPEP_0203683858 /NCGR_PEP_ID=MMETSP0090-20130426/47740_1 /ASSEMBLY_ACC=CAM_ASM_001088 /TAXON_ID=426623 /ORGANISM="Chaetoceros affinis, Strain CCMP159" /LENGTH=186 /DNA_ID=CAMNT_0050553015 /DNA_START=1855 /DNA_END=2412 /DNA_ORIENTATION=+